MISVLLATTGRSLMAAEFCESLYDTTAGHEVELIAAVDADPITRDLLETLVDVMLYEDEYRGCSKAWNDCLRVSGGDPVVLAADDVRFHPGWLDAALETLRGFPGGWGFVGLNDGHWNAGHATHYVMSRKLISDVFGGVVAWECYTHSFNDCEANQRAQDAGRYAWCETARISHEHWLWGDRPQDTTDTRNLGGHPASQAAFNARQAAGFPNDYEPAI